MSMTLEQDGHQRRDVLAPFTQGRQMDGKHMEPVEEILTELALGNARLEIDVGRGSSAATGQNGLTPTRRSTSACTGPNMLECEGMQAVSTNATITMTERSISWPRVYPAPLSMQGRVYVVQSTIDYRHVQGVRHGTPLHVRVLDSTPAPCAVTIHVTG